MSHGNVSFLPSFPFFSPELRKRVFHSTCSIFSSCLQGPRRRRGASGGCVVIDEREKFWPLATTAPASPAGRTAKIFADRPVRVVIVRYHREQRILRGDSSLRSSSACNLVCKHTRVHVDKPLCPYSLVCWLAAGYFARLPNKGPTTGWCPVYLVRCNNEIMVDALRLTKQCGLFDGRFPPFHSGECSPRTFPAALSLHFPHGK